MSASASATRSSKTTFPSSVEMSRVTDCLLRPRYFHQSPTPSFWGPKWRRWSPVSGCSTLITSAPKSASRRPTVPIEIIDPASITVTPSRGRRGVIVGRRVVGSGPAVGGRVATHKGLPGVSTPPWAVRAVRSVAVRVLCPVISGLCVVVAWFWTASGPRVRSPQSDWAIDVGSVPRLADDPRPPRRRPDRERPCASATRSPRAPSYGE